MSGKQKKLSKKYLSRPFAPDILERARKIAAAYQIVIGIEDGEYFGRGLEMPGATGDGKTPDACVANTRAAMVAGVAYMLENGDTPPAPAAGKSRSVQVNVRMTNEEKLLIEEAARQKGFGGISDYVRAAALSAGK